MPCGFLRQESEEFWRYVISEALGLADVLPGPVILSLLIIDKPSLVIGSGILRIFFKHAAKLRDRSVVSVGLDEDILLTDRLGRSAVTSREKEIEYHSRPQ